MHDGTLYIIATPIGNMEDITLRALRILGEVDVIFCEDTRVTGKLLNYYNIRTRMISMNARTEERKIEQVLTFLKNGKNVAYVSDAGTPGISDPGVRLVAHSRETGVRIIAIPGPSALITALSIAGVPTNKFVFFGFLPQKKGRQTILKQIADSSVTCIFYESTHRIIKLLSELDIIIGDNKKVTLARELTKIYEEIITGTPHDVMDIIENDKNKQKGEFVIIVSS